MDVRSGKGILKQIIFWSIFFVYCIVAVFCCILFHFFVNQRIFDGELPVFSASQVGPKGVFAFGQADVVGVFAFGQVVTGSWFTVSQVGIGFITISMVPVCLAWVFVPLLFFIPYSCILFKNCICYKPQFNKNQMENKIESIYEEKRTHKEKKENNKIKEPTFKPPKRKKVSENQNNHYQYDNDLINGQQQRQSTEKEPSTVNIEDVSIDYNHNLQVDQYTSPNFGDFAADVDQPIENNKGNDFYAY